MKIHAYILFSFLFFWNNSEAQNGFPINIKDSTNITDFGVLAEKIKGKKIFMIGEDHRYRANNSMLEYKYLRYLHENNDVNYLVLEFGYSVGWMLEQYILHNNQKIAKILSNYSYKEYYDAYQFFADYAKRTELKNFKIKGIDLERELPYSVKALSLMIPENKKPFDSIQVGIESIIALSQYYDTKVKDNVTENFPEKLAINAFKTIDLILTDYDRKSDLYKEYIDEFANDFDVLIQTMKVSKVWWKENYEEFPAQAFVERELFMKNKIDKIFENDSSAKIFGQFGRCHVLNNFTQNECPFYNFYSLSARLHETEKYKGLIYTIGVFYPNEVTFMDNKLEAYKTLNKYINKSPKNELTLYFKDSDMVDTSELFDRFNALIINNNKIPGQRGYQFSNNDVKNPFLYGFYYRGSFTQLDMSSFNHYFQARFKEQFYNHGFAVSITDFEKFYQLEYDFYTTVSNPVTHGSSINFKGSRIKSRMGYNIFNSGTWQLIPSIAIGYDSKSMMIKTSPSDSIKHYFDEKYDEKYILNKMVVDFGINLGFSKSHFTLHGFVNSQFLLGNNQWKYNSQKSNLVPVLSKKQWFYGIQIGVSF